MKIIADLHTHTVASTHAYSTIAENVKSAAEGGLLWLGTSDHAPALSGAPDQTFFRNLKVLKRQWMDVFVLRGVELNILNEYGEVDLPKEVLSELDYAIASLHFPIFPKDSRHLCTDAVIAAMENPAVLIIGHPDDDLMPLDYQAVTAAAKANNVALEVNNSSLSPNSFRQGAKSNIPKMLKLAKKLDVPVIISSDSHICYDIGRFDLAISLLESVDFPQELVVNSSSKRFIDFFAARRQTKTATRATY